MRENPLINSIAKRIAEKCSPHKIILISYKTNNYSELTSFKLALIVDDSTESMPELECSLYMDIDSDIPFDLVFYTVSEWNSLKDNEGTFAWKINNTGAVLYE
jgi:hypothetical protein